MKTRRSQLISRRKGIISGAILLPDGKHIVYTVSMRGQTDIIQLNLETKKIFQLTKNIAEDVDPDVSSDGKYLTFLSDRPGRAMIYLMDLKLEKDFYLPEHNVRRLSFVGKFHATPRFSPDAQEIVFSSWLHDRFDLFRINLDGSQIVKLTKDFGSNEDPSFSLDGEFIAFSSEKIFKRNNEVESFVGLYLIDRMGQKIFSIITDFGNCVSPRWSK